MIRPTLLNTLLAVNLALSPLFLWPITACADLSDWEVVRFKGRVGTYVRSTHDSRLIIPIMNDFGKSASLKASKTMKINTHIERIIYYAGKYGTFSAQEVYRAILFDTSTRRLLGEFPIAASEADPAKENDPLDAKWTEQPGLIVISEPQDFDGSVSVTEIQIPSGKVTTKNVLQRRAKVQ